MIIMNSDTVSLGREWFEASKFPLLLHLESKDNWKLMQFSNVVLILFAGVLALGLKLVLVWWQLHHIPGPFLASLTNFTRMRWVLTKRAHFIHQDLHEKYGDVVRMGPNMVSISNPAVIHTLYPTRRGFVKVS